MPSDIYNFSIKCAELLESCSNRGRIIFSGLISAFYIAVNDISKNHANIDLSDRIKNNIPYINKILPEPPVWANFLDISDSIITHMLKLDKRQFINNPEILGWMYQYFNKPGKDAAYMGLRKNIKISGASLAPATQIFTPKWIARYLTENAILRIAQPKDYPCASKYYIADAHRCLDLSIADPLKLKLLDPCMGCGHILLAAFDVLMDLYISRGYQPGEAAYQIITKNLYGLDIDSTAVSIGCFSLYMKAAAYGSILSFEEMNLFSFDEFKSDYRELGSLLEPASPSLACETGVAAILSQKYDIIVTNPPYMGNHNMSDILSEYVKKNYPLSKTDLSTVFIERAFRLCKPRGIVAMINIHSWLFLPTYENFREYLIKNKTLLSLLDLDQGVFENTTLIRAVAFLMINSNESDYTGTYLKLYNRYDAQLTASSKESLFFDLNRRYYCKASSFLCIPRKIFAYALNKETRDIMIKAKKLSDYGKPRQGLKTGDNARFIRLWHEVPRNEICFSARSREEAAASGCKWFPYNKAGEYRKWYGNNRYIVNWENDGAEIRNFKDENGRLRSRPQNMDFFFKNSVSWNMISSTMSARFIPEGFIFDGAGGGLFSSHNDYLLGYLNSCAAENFFNVTSQSINYNVGQIAELPVILSDIYYDKVTRLVKDCVRLSKDDWDELEASWDFNLHPLIKIRRELKSHHVDLNKCCLMLDKKRRNRYDLLREREESLNRLFMEIYSISQQDCGEFRTALRKTYLQTDIISLISFAVGCMFGRYKCEGFYEANKNEMNGLEINKAVDLFTVFLQKMFGYEKLTENTAFVASSLGVVNNRAPKEVIFDYFNKHFINDHEKAYLRRPVYSQRGNKLFVSIL